VNYYTDAGADGQMGRKVELSLLVLGYICKGRNVSAPAKMFYK